MCRRDPAGDASGETDETITLTIGSPSNATLGQATGLGTIRDDDVASRIVVGQGIRQKHFPR